MDQGMEAEGNLWLKPQVEACHQQQAWGPMLTFSCSAGSWEPSEVCAQEGHKVSVRFWKRVWQPGGRKGEEAQEVWKACAAAAKALCDNVEAREPEGQE